MPKLFESLESRTLYAATPVTLEAEAAAMSAPMVYSSNAGFTGSGYVDYQRSTGDWIEWTVNSPSAGTHKLSFRYANGSGDRPLELRVNGRVVQAQLPFPVTGSWRTWQNVTLDVALPAGANKVRLTTAGVNGPNVDSLTVTPPDETLPPPPPPPPTGGVFEAESAAKLGPTFDNSIPGFTGTGFLDYGGTAGQWVEWSVNGESAGARTLTFRYANGATSDRPLELRVNGVVAAARVSFAPTGSFRTWKTVSVTAPLAAGVNKVRLTSVGAGPNVDSLSVSGTTQPPPPPPTGSVYQAESAGLFGPSVGRSLAGFTGTGYADYARATGDVIEWVVNSPGAGTRTITFRYANGSGDRPLELRVNGQVVSSRLSFPPTGSWSTWKTVGIAAPLAAGANSIRLTSVGSNGPNIDSVVIPDTVQPTAADRLKVAVDFAGEQLRRTAAEIPTATYVNYTLSDGTWHVLPDPAWEAGFLPGSMWQMYERTGDVYWKNQATARTLPLEVERDRRYDASFVIFKSFKPLYDQTGNPEYREIMLDAARAKATWYHEEIGAFRGWVRRSTSGDPRAEVGFYVDLMADLELFIWAAKETGNPQWMDMAVTHAETTAEYLIRPDGSSIQWGYFEDATGEFVKGEQYQGYNDQSTWSRGQAWAIYGFALAYRELGNPLFLETAKKVADWYLAHLPADKVPYWDFNDPKIPNTYRDSSAAAIAAAGLLDLAKQLPGTSDAGRYRAAAEATLLSLSGPSYLSQGTTNRAVLRHAALNVPRNVGNDVGLIVGDYFYLEAIDRYFEPL